VALVGYTNSGKSTLLNHLSQADVYVADQLFATLDPTTRRVELPSGNQILITDTVGFIQKLPTELVAAFRATLEEITEADLLLHMVDITHVNAIAQAEVVHQTLAEIEADHIPVLPVLNKIDKLSDPTKARKILEFYPDAVAISALRGDGIGDLLGRINENLFSNMIPITVQLPYKQGGLISAFHEYGQADEISHVHGGIVIRGRLPGRLIAQFKPYIRAGQPEDDTSDPIEQDSEY